MPSTSKKSSGQQLTPEPDDISETHSVAQHGAIDYGDDPVRETLNKMRSLIFQDYQSAREALAREKKSLMSDDSSESSDEPEFYGGKSSKTVSAYRSRQLGYIDWAREKIHCKYPEIITSRRLTLYMKDTLETVNSKHRVNGPGMYDACTSALQELMEMQKEVLPEFPQLTDLDEPKCKTWPPSLRDIQVRSYIGTKKNFDNYVKRPHDMMKSDATDPVEYVKGLRKLSENTLGKGEFSMHFAAIGCHSLMMRTEAMKDMELSGILVGETAKGDTVLYFETTNMSGYTEISASLRHKDPLFCSHLSLALLMYSRFHFRRNRKFEEPIDFSELHWQQLKIIRGLTPITALSSSRYDVRIRQEVKDAGVQSKNLSRYFQSSAARYCLENFVPTLDVQIFGHWSDNPDFTNPDAIVPMTTMHFLAGFKADEPYHIRRNDLIPPPSVTEKIFPFINDYLKAIQEGNLEDYVISERLKKSEAVLSTPTNGDGEPKKVKKRKKKHFRPSSEELQKIIDAVLLFDYLRKVLVQDIPIAKEYIPTIRNRHTFQWKEFLNFSVLQCRHHEEQDISLDMPKAEDQTFSTLISNLHQLESSINWLRDEFPCDEDLLAIELDTQTENDGEDEEITDSEGFDPQECLSIREIYEDFKAMDVRRASLTRKFKIIRKIPKYRAYQRRQNIYRLVERFVARGYDREEALEIIENDFLSQNCNLVAYCDMRKDEINKKYNL